MLAAQRQFLQGNGEPGDEEDDDGLGAIDFNAAREEAKEDEYDYFTDNQPEENSGNA